MVTGVFFSNSTIFDQMEVRLAVLRIPEVTAKLRQAQKLIDRELGGAIDLTNLLASEDSWYLKNTHAKGLASALVQIGLYERFLKSFPQPQFLLGNCKGDSPLNVISGQISFEDLIRQSQAFRSKQHLLMVGNNLPILSGMALAEYAVYQATNVPGATVAYSQIRLHSPHLRHILTSLVEESQVKRLVNIGPAMQANLQEPSFSVLQQLDVQFVNSVELDPMLSWFQQNRIAVSH